MNLTKESFLIHAMKAYDNPSCSGMDEFYDDLKRFSYLQKLFKKKHKNKFFNIKLALNHLIILYNLFGIKTTELLFFKIDEKYWQYLKPFLVLMNYMPERIDVGEGSILSSDIPMDLSIIEELRKI